MLSKCVNKKKTLNEYCAVSDDGNNKLSYHFQLDDLKPSVNCRDSENKLSVFQQI